VDLHPAVLAPADIESHHGFRVTIPTRTILDCADSELDPDRFGAAVQDALASGRVRRKRLIAGVQGLSARGRRRLSDALEKAHAA
jgi:hypothetical protein